MVGKGEHLMSVGIDLAPKERIIVKPGKFILVESNKRWLDIIGNNHDCWGMVVLRSGYQRKGLIMASPGVVDPDWTGFILIGGWNITDEDIIIEEGERFAQIVPIPVVNRLIRRKHGN